MVTFNQGLWLMWWHYCFPKIYLTSLYEVHTPWDAGEQLQWPSEPGYGDSGLDGYTKDRERDIQKMFWTFTWQNLVKD